MGKKCCVASSSILLFCPLPYFESGDNGRNLSTYITGQKNLEAINEVQMLSSASSQGNSSLNEALERYEKQSAELDNTPKGFKATDLSLFSQEKAQNEGVNLLKELVQLSYPFRSMNLFTDRFGRVASILFYGSVDNFPEIGNLTRIVGKQAKLCESSLLRDYEGGRIRDLLSFSRSDTMTALYHDRFDAMVSNLRRAVGQSPEFSAAVRKIAHDCADGHSDSELEKMMRDAVGVQGDEIGEPVQRELGTRLLAFIRQNRYLLPHFFRSLGECTR